MGRRDRVVSFGRYSTEFEALAAAEAADRDIAPFCEDEPGRLWLTPTLAAAYSVFALDRLRITRILGIRARQT